MLVLLVIKIIYYCTVRAIELFVYVEQNGESAGSKKSILVLKQKMKILGDESVVKMKKKIDISNIKKSR